MPIGHHIRAVQEQNQKRAEESTPEAENKGRQKEGYEVKLCVDRVEALIAGGGAVVEIRDERDRTADEDGGDHSPVRHHCLFCIPDGACHLCSYV